MSKTWLRRTDAYNYLLESGPDIRLIKYFPGIEDGV
jgi:hypothetical protein